MAFQAAPALCSTAAYQNFLPLAGFPPAQGWCSTVSLLPRRSEQDSANDFALQDIKCPVGNNLCALLADLKAADREFARGVCCCIGVCVGDEPTAVITIPGATMPTIPASTSSSSSWSMSYIQRHSSDSLEPMPSVLTSSTSSDSSFSSLFSSLGTISSSSISSSIFSTSSSTSSSGSYPTSTSLFPSSTSSSFSSTMSSTSKSD